MPQSNHLQTALVVNVEKATRDIVAIDAQKKVPQVQEAPKEVEVKTPVASKPQPVVKDEKATPIIKDKKSQNEVKPSNQRASNDPRSRRKNKQVPTKPLVPTVAPTQNPALKKHSILSLIQQVYGEDCSILIEQFGLVPTFNRALAKFTEQYAQTLVATSNVEDIAKTPVTRDVIVQQKTVQEEQPAPVLSLTPEKENQPRVANDPRERRRLAKKAAEQAHEQAKAKHLQEEAEQQPVVAEQTASKPAPKQPQKDVVPTEAKEVDVAEQKTPAEEAVVPVAKAKRATKAKADTADKAARPRRPRGRPPKKAVTPPTSE